MQESPSTSSSEDRFPQVWARADAIGGWLTEDQGRLLDECARALPDGAHVLEIGSHQGRSTVVLGSVLRGKGGRLYAVDPFVEGKKFGGSKTRDIFERNVAEAGLSDTVELVCDYSTRIRSSWTKPFQLLYIDGKHDYWTFSDDLKWRAHLPDGAAVLVHDCFTSTGVTLGVLAHVLFASDLRYERRVGSLAVFRLAEPSRADRVRILRELPWWVRNVLVKGALRARLRPVARLLGHDSPVDVY